jgi:hypothetical protein
MQVLLMFKLISIQRFLCLRFAANDLILFIGFTALCAQTRTNKLFKSVAKQRFQIMVVLKSKDVRRFAPHILT